MRKYPIIEIDEVEEPFCGCRMKNLVPLVQAHPEIADEWCYEKNAGWGPEDFSRASGVRCWWICSKCNRKYKAQICCRTSGHTACPYCASKKVCKDNSLVDLYPEVARQWHPSKNKTFKSTDAVYGSRKRAWWLCDKCGHEWSCAIADRTTLQSGCPACYEARMQYAREHPKPYVKKRIVLGEGEEISRLWYEKPSNEDFVSIVETHLSIARQWHPTKNGPWKAWQFAKGSDATAWWRCKKGPDHEWQAPIYSRTKRKKAGCPFCENFRLSVTNSLKTKYPTLAKELHPKLNGKLRPENIIAAGKKEYWWQCSKNLEHVWKTAISNRINGFGCQYCSGKIRSKETSLVGQFPYVAAQFHPTKNGSLKASELAPLSSKKCWWICKKKHEWEATVRNRTGRGSNCPVCAGRVVSDSNSLAALYPDIAKQWDKRKNGKLTANDVTAHSKKVVFWKCNAGHSWKQPVGKRTKTEGSCYECRTGLPRPGTKNK